VERSRPRRALDVDQVVAAGSALGLVAVAALLLLDYRGGGARRPPADTIARLAALEGAVRCQSAGTLVWESAGAEQPLAAGDAVFVQPGGAATIAFRGGAMVDLEERSLVVVEPPDAESERVNVLAGSVVAEAGSAGLSVRTGARSALVEPGGAVAVDPGAGLELLEGRARVDGELRGAERRVALVTPARSHRIYVQHFPTSLALRWDGEAARTYALEVSRERSFATRVASAPGSAGFFEVSVDAPGPWYWRIADAAGSPVSEVRKFVAVADRAPRPFSPASGEIVLAPQGVQVPFWWTAVAGAAGYRVEVASDPAFQRLALSEPASGPGLWAELDLPEGTYYWRVRAERPRDGDHLSPSSATVVFRLIRRPVLDAPELFDASIEGVGHAR
jgi:hypothetical protein